MELLKKLPHAFTERGVTQIVTKFDRFLGGGGCERIVTSCFKNLEDSKFNNRFENLIGIFFLLISIKSIIQLKRYLISKVN